MPAASTPSSPSTPSAPTAATKASRQRVPVARSLDALPLRAKLIVATLGLLAIALVLTAIVTGTATHRFLIDQTDDELRQLSRTVAPLQLQQLLNDQSLIPVNFTLRVVTPSGVVKVGDAVGAEGAEPDLAQLSIARLRSQEITTVPGLGDRPTWRVLGGPIVGTDAAYALAIPMSGVDATVANILWRSALIGLAILVACGALGWYAVRVTLQPMREIEETAAAIAAGDRNRRVPELQTRDEVASLAASINEMLTQIETSLERAEESEERMRQFVADASHELRTPLVAIGGYAELYRQGAISEPAEIASSMRRIEHEARRMTTLVEDLLVLARFDRDQPLVLGPTDLAVIAADAVQDARAIQPDREILLHGLHGRVRPVELLADERRLRQVVANLIVNAVRHTPAGTPIDVTIGKEPGGVALIKVADHGPGIDAQVRSRIFERFYRTDSSRGRGTGGSGLGLAIVQAIVSAHRGRIDVDDTSGGGATFTVALPTAGSYLPPSHSPDARR